MVNEKAGAALRCPPRVVSNVVRTGATPRMESILKMAEALGEDPALKAAKPGDLGLNKNV